MTAESADVVVVGGGIVGLSAAYYLGEAGVSAVIVERDAVGSHASGFAYGGLAALSSDEVPRPTESLAVEGIRLHRQLSNSLPEETGVNIDFRTRPTLALAFSEQEAEEARRGLGTGRTRKGTKVSWADRSELASIEPRISDEAFGGVFIEGTYDVEPYRLILALTAAAERRGALVRHGTVTGLKTAAGRVQGVRLENSEIRTATVVLAMGPWAGAASEWLGIQVPVGPLKGQILRLRAPGPPFQCSIGWQGNYFTTKPDGLVWAGTTEEDVGFDERPTEEARAQITSTLLKMAPSLTNAELVRQTACLRPLSSDRLPVIGEVPGRGGVFLVTGAGRQGIVFGPAMGRIVAGLITEGSSDFAIDAFDPGRFESAD